MSEPNSAEHPVIEFRHVCYEIEGGRELLHDVDLQVYAGETLLLLGKSGSGKTTTLKLINHLLTPTGGDLIVEGKLTREWDVIRLRRRIGYVIQEIGLFPHFTVARNIAVVPQIENWPRERSEQRVRELLEVVGLSREFATRYPHELSGGQRQRVGVARALAADPPILLMDEPFGALDPITRAELQREFQALQQRLRKTVVFVTHDLREALVLGTRIALIEDGRMLATLTPDEFLGSSLPQVTAYLQSFDLPRHFSSKTPDSARSFRP
jgi:osmoprotectant transport system ATP-binding protein